MRTLYIVPIVHSLVDLGKLAPRVVKAKAKLLPGFDSQSTELSVSEFWRGLRSAIESWNVDFGQLMLFQDALPSAPREQPGIERLIVQSLAEQGSQNHQILLWLVDQGAELVGTESIELLMEEYRLALASLEDDAIDSASDAAAESSQLPQAIELLRKRDRYIATRIDYVLDEATIGVLFLGLMHSVEPWLADDIEVSYPFGQPRNVSVRP